MATNTKICPIIFAGALGNQIEALRDHTLGEIAQCQGSGCAWWLDGACGIVANRFSYVSSTQYGGLTNAND